MLSKAETLHLDLKIRWWSWNLNTLIWAALMWRHVITLELKDETLQLDYILYGESDGEIEI